MAQFPYRANLSSGFFPPLTRYQGRTVVIPGKDQFYKDRLTLSQPQSPEDEGIPQIYYCQNVMPSSGGLASIGFLPQLAGLAGKTDFSNLFLIRDTNENKYLYSPGLGTNYIYNANFGGWTAVGGPSSPLVTVAYINGFTYIFFKGIGLYQYNPFTNTLDVVALTGVTVTALNGICASSGFLIAWDNFSVYRGKASSILDFTPDPTQGSGASIPQDIKGQIVCCLPILAGFIIYTTKNAVGATFSNNIRYPFIYKEVQGSSGVTDPTQVSWQENTGEHYAWTQDGLQIVNKTQAKQTFPEMTDFLTCNILEDFNALTNQIFETRLTAQLQIRVATVAQSFLVISYGINTFDFALVFDLKYKRWGKVKITHAAAFELILPNLSGDLSWTDLGAFGWADLSTSSWADLGIQLQTTELANNTLAFLGIDGSVVTVDFSNTGANQSGVLVMGKYQLTRDRWMSMQDIDIECVDVDSNMQLFLLASIDGKNVYSTTELIAYNSAGQLKQYHSDIQGQNLSLLFKGTFALDSLQMMLKQEGKT